MSERIKITMTDGTVKEFVHRGRPGGSYTIRLSFEGEFAIVTDEWGNRTAFPGARIDKIEETSDRRW